MKSEHAILLIAVLAMAACSDAGKASYTQPSYAKYPNAKCEQHAEAFYAEKAKTGTGIEEVIFLSCQSKQRADYHERLGQAGDREQLQLAIACASENVTAIEALQKAGVTAFHCPTK